LAAAPLAGQDPAPEPQGVRPHDFPGPKYAEILIPAGTHSGLSLVQAHDNRVPAGRVENGVRVVNLEVQRADWRIEGPEGPGLRVAAVGEVGGVPSIPAPLIRATAGTRLRVSVHNRLEASLHVFGLHARPGEAGSHVTVPGGGTATVEFEAGAAGTYLYHMVEGDLPPDPPDFFAPERGQLAGALVVDAADGSGAEDRLLVINAVIESVPTDVHPGGFLEAFTINGRSWPYTELLKMEVGRGERWRVVNGTRLAHPMHLHGFYFDVKSRGTTYADTLYAPAAERSVVTETLDSRSTMLMEWTPTRPGRWIFHCHVTFHVTAEMRLPGAAESNPAHAHSHMAGLVMGIDVAPGPSDLIARAEPTAIDLHAKVYGSEVGNELGFDLSEGPPRPGEVDVPGPLLVFNQYEPVDVTVHNALGQPTSVHWHGLELDAWADGVPDWSASDGRMSPSIPPGESFTYRLSMMRPGTFMYHTHLNDLRQLTAGLYGPLIVLPPGETFDPGHDHPRIFGWRTVSPEDDGDIEMNGLGGAQPDGETTVGETHRFRIMNIMPDERVGAWVFRDGQATPVRLLAKDGADLP
ncbi:MAG: multicopper oxidase domain-containing protein, partial [Longimicrobiales bacterium]|nr:multicopper oxidase domain-containing protein [Longimicrobiales bacterium]